MTFTDEELTAFLDGEASAESAAQISAALENDVELQGRLASLDVLLPPMKDAFGRVLDAAPDMEPLPTRRHEGGVSKTKMLAAMAASLVIGALISFWVDHKRDWRDYAAAYHVLYVNGTLADVNPTPTEAKATLERLGAVVGHDLAAAPLDTVLEYKRGQVLGYQGQPLIQLAYLSPLGDPVALCLIRAEGANRAIYVAELEGLAAAQWQRDGIAYLLIGGTDESMIQEAAVRFFDAL